MTSVFMMLIVRPKLAQACANKSTIRCMSSAVDALRAVICEQQVAEDVEQDLALSP